MPVEPGKINTAAAEFAVRPPLIADDGRDVRVMDEQGRTVKHQWVNPQGELETDPFAKGRHPRLQFEIADPAVKTYLIYFGNPKAPAEPGKWDKKVGALTLETRVNPRKRLPNNWRDMTALVAASHWKYGEGPRRQINDPENPFGPSQNYISIYRGAIFCPVAGAYTFATDSDDASFMLINGRIVVQWPGGHSPSGRFDHYGTVSLPAGVHRVEYYHVQSGGGSLARAGWRPPGATGFDIIPEEAFVREIRTRTVIVEKKARSLNAFFAYDMVQSLQFGGTGPVFTTVSFRDLSRSAHAKVVAWAWDFGDGAASDEQNPRHVFSGALERTVSLRCIDSLGFESAWTQTIGLPAAGASRADVAMELSIGQVFLLPDEPLRARLRCRNSGVAPVDMALATEWDLGEGRVLRAEREPVTLKPGVWVVRDVVAERDGKSAFDVGDIVFRLEYLGKTVLERRAAICRTTDVRKRLHVEQDRLSDERGAHVVLRLAGKIGRRKPLDVREKLKRGGPYRIVVLDGSLAGSGPINYIDEMKQRLQDRFSDSVVRVSRVNPAKLGSRAAAVLRGLLQTPEQIARLKPDLVIVAGSLREILRFTPVARFENSLRARVDRIQAVTGAQVALLAPPPTIANPKLAQSYAVAVKRVGMFRGVPVADTYSAFMQSAASRERAGRASRDGWRAFYRDPDSRVPLYYVAPTAEGQKLIADTLMDVLLPGERTTE